MREPPHTQPYTEDVCHAGLRESPLAGTHASACDVGLHDPPRALSRKERRRAQWLKERNQPPIKEFVYECMRGDLKLDDVANYVKKSMIEEIEPVFIEGLSEHVVGDKIIFKVDRQMTKAMILFIKNAVEEFCQKHRV